MATQELETPIKTESEENNYWDEIPHPAEMSFFDHLEELRTRIFVSLIAVLVSAIACFAFVRPLVGWLEIPAKGVKFLQLAPGEFFFVSIHPTKEMFLMNGWTA